VDGLGASALVCTRKDIVKMSDVGRLRRPVFALGVELRFTSGEAAMLSVLARRSWILGN
jgi:hypothetical protein